jgi:tetratricopeptide (TPR) repeat protein
MTGPDMPASLRSRAESLLGILLSWLGELERGLSHLEIASAAARESGDPNEIGRVQVSLGGHWENAGDCLRSAAAHREAAQVLRSKHDSIFLGMALGELGDRLLICGDIDEAIPLIGQGLEHDRRLGFSSGIAIALGQRAHAARLQGELDLATRLFGESIAVARELGDERRVLGAFIGLAGIALDRGDPERAARLVGATEAARELRGVSRGIAHPLHNERIISAVRERLGEETYEAFVAEGRTIPYEQVIAEALAALDESPAAV